MNHDDYQKYDGLSLARLISSGEVTPFEVCQSAVEVIESKNPLLNAVSIQNFESALARARSEEFVGPFFGVPYLVKDLNTYVKGLPATNGSAALKGFLPQSDSILVQRIKDSGLNILGKTNTPEFGLNICTAPSLFGATLNPINTEYSAGGSSGGSAAAVAAGMVPWAHATDSGGSIRIPASHCGLFGLKPSRSRIPLGNDMPEGLAGFSTAHAVTHSVRDSAHLLAATMGPLPGDLYTSPVLHDGFLDRVSIPPEKLRVAYWMTGFANEAVHAECQQAVRTTLEICEHRGWLVEECRPPVDGTALRDAFNIIFAANIAAVVNPIISSNPSINPEQLFEPTTLDCARQGAVIQAEKYVRALQSVQMAAGAMGTFFDRYDVLLTPVMANPPLKIGDLSMQEPNWTVYLNKLLDEIPFTPLFNATGSPAISVPMSTSSNHLPIGVQFAAGIGQEELLLKLAGALEQDKPWHQKVQL